MPSGSYRSTADELPVDESRRDQKTQNHRDNCRNLAPLVDDIQFLGHRCLLRGGIMHDVQAVILAAGNRLPPEEQAQHYQCQKTPDDNQWKETHKYLPVAASQRNLPAWANGQASGYRSQSSPARNHPNPPRISDIRL